jgi:hypothetical protein
MAYPSFWFQRYSHPTHNILTISEPFAPLVGFTLYATDVRAYNMAPRVPMIDTLAAGARQR